MKTPTKLFETEQDWLSARRLGIGGSDAAAAIGASRWKSPLELYTEKLGFSDKEAEKDEHDAMRWGKKLEKPIREAYSDETERPVWIFGYHQFVSNDNPFMTCTVDGIVTPIDKPAGVFESKATSYYSEREILEEIPIEYQIQVQHEMAVCEMDWASIAVLLHGRKLLWFDVPREDAFISVLIAKEKELWERIQEKNPPPPSEPFGSSLRALKNLYPTGNGMVVLSEDDLTAAMLMEAAKKEKKKWEGVEEEAKAKLIAAIGENEVGVLPGGASYTLKLRKGYLVPEHTVEAVRILRRWERK